MSQLFKQFLQEIKKERVSGPSPSFSEIHMLLAVEFIAEKPIGRNKLAKKLEMGEGAIRTLLGRLRRSGFVTVSKAGCALTRKGLGLSKEYGAVVKKTKIGRNELTSTNHSYAILIRDGGQKLRSGIEQRDAAVKAGAIGATTMVFKKGHLVIPSVTDHVARDFPKAADQIMELLEPKEKDVVIIVDSNSLEKAVYGVLSAAWTILDST